MNTPVDNKFIRQMLEKITKDCRVLEHIQPENDEEKVALILRGFKPSFTEGWYVLYGKDSDLRDAQV